LIVYWWFSVVFLIGINLLKRMLLAVVYALFL